MNQQLSSSQLRAARALMNWTRAELSIRSEVGEQTIHRMENDRGKPETRTQYKLRAALEQAGVRFTERGVEWADDVVKVLEGGDAYLKMLDDIYYVTHKTGGEVLFFCSDDRSTRPGEYEGEARIRSNNVTFRCLIEEGNNYIRWPRKEYRQIPSKYFNHNLQVIYGNKVAQLIDGGNKILTITNSSLATTAHNIFDLLWTLMRPLSKKE